MTPIELTHADLMKRAVTWLRGTMRCSVVLSERESRGERVDAIGFGKQVIVIECKVSRADFLADQIKACRRVSGMGALRFYLAPARLLSHREMPEGWGLLEAQADRIKRTWQAHPILDERRNREAEQALLVGELRRYQLHGIEYPPLVRKQA